MEADGVKWGTVLRFTPQPVAQIQIQCMHVSGQKSNCHFGKKLILRALMEKKQVEKDSPQERADTETSPTSKPSKATSACVCGCVQSQEEHVCACDHMCMCEWAGGYKSC